MSVNKSVEGRKKLSTTGTIMILSYKLRINILLKSGKDEIKNTRGVFSVVSFYIQL